MPASPDTGPMHIMTMTPRQSAVVAGITAVALLAGPVGSAQQPPPQTPRVGFTEGVSAVLVDLVVRNRRGEPIRDLRQDEIEILEDGVPQTIGSFTPNFDDGLPSGAPAAPAGAPATPAAASGPGAAGARTPPVIALVFDRLGSESRRLAIQASQSYLGTSAQTSGYVGIFGVDLSLREYAPFTRNGKTLRQGLGEVASRASSAFATAEFRQQKASADERGGLAARAASTAESGGGAGAGGNVGGAPGEAQLAQMESQMLSDFDTMERDQQGYATTNGLFAIIKTMRVIPGRKSLVLFSEGMSIPPAVQRLFLGVVDAANRANVSIYAMDAAGLRTESEQAKIRDQVNDAAKVGINTGYANGGGSEPLTKSLEKNEDVLRQDPHNGLGELAQSTGGLLFDNGNNLKQGFDRVEEDLRSYYLVGYTSTNQAYDGRFRTIDVKVKRPGVTVSARKGYFAVRDTGGMPVNTWEAPALGALEQKPVPNAFPIRAAALSFPEPSRPGLVPVVVDLPTGPLTFAAEPDGKTYSSDFAVVARFIDAKNQVVRKVSQRYQVRGPIAQLERAKQGEVVFYREPELPPGLYTMETVVFDAPSGRSSVRFSSVDVPKLAGTELLMSSLIMVKRSEQVPEKDRRGNNPLMVNGLVLYPNLSEPISKAAKEAAFYFAAYPAPGGGQAEAALQLSLNGAAVASIPLTLAAPDASGRIQQVGRIPLDQLAPGTYELSATVRQGNRQIARSTVVRITQ